MKGIPSSWHHFFPSNNKIAEDKKNKELILVTRISSFVLLFRKSLESHFPTLPLLLLFLSPP